MGLRAVLASEATPYDADPEEEEEDEEKESRQQGGKKRGALTAPLLQRAGRGQLLRSPFPNVVASLGGEQRWHKMVATDQSPDGCVVAGNVRPQLRDHRLNEELLVEPRSDLCREHRRVVAENGHVLLEPLDGVHRCSIPHPVG